MGTSAGAERRADTCRVAVVQASPVFLDRDATIEKGIALINEAADAGARVIAFPEVWIPGYPLWIYGAAGWGDEAAKRGFAKLHEQSLEVPSAACDGLSKAAVARGVDVVVGINEVSGGTLHNSLLYLMADGRVAVHRKLVPTHAERMIWAASEDGSGLLVLDAPYGGASGAAYGGGGVGAPSLVDPFPKASARGSSRPQRAQKRVVSLPS